MTNESLIIKSKSLNQYSYKFDVIKSRTYEERYIDLDLYKKVISNLDELEDYVGYCYDVKKCERVDWAGTKTILIETFKRKKKSLSVSYAPTRSNPKGRHFSKEKSLQGMSRKLRHLICHENYTDIDIKNCHPVIFTQLCSEYNFDCSHISYYINNRESCLNELMNITDYSREECKNSMISLLNGGSCNKIFNNFQVPNWFSNFAYQIEIIHKQLANHDDLKDCHKEVKRKYGLDVFNFNGKVVNRLLCCYENILIQHAIYYCSLNGIYVASPQFDGMLCENNPILNQNFLQDLEKYILDETGFKVNFCIKEMDEHIPLMEKLKSLSTSDIVHLNADENKPLKPADSHEDIAIYIISQFEKDKNVYYSAKRNRIYVYNENTKLFEEKSVDIIMNFVSFYMIPIIEPYSSYLYKVLQSISKDDEKYDEYKNESLLVYKLSKDVKNVGFQKFVLSGIKTRIKDDDLFIENTFNKIKHLLPIADIKVINLKTLEIEERCKEHYFTYTTDNIFKADRPNREWVYNYVSEILKTDNPEFVQCFLTHLGYCITGETCIKKFPIWTGDGDNGKSACFNVIKKIFGKFAIVGNEKVFLKQKSNSVHSDEYLPLIGKRFSYIQEIDANSLFNEKLIKSITGGDGDISLRACGGTTVEVILDCKLLCICNGDDIPNFIDKQGFTNRLMVIPFKNKFERDAKKLIEIESMKDDIFTELCFYVKEFFYDNNMDIKFSIEIESATNEVKENKDSIKQFMDEKIQITTDDKDRIKKASIFNSYSFYCKNSDFKDCAIGMIAFYKTLREKYNLEIHRDREFKCVKFIQDDYDLTIDNGLPPL